MRRAEIREIIIGFEFVLSIFSEIMTLPCPISVPSLHRNMLPNSHVISQYSSMLFPDWLLGLKTGARDCCHRFKGDKLRNI